MNMGEKNCSVEEKDLGEQKLTGRPKLATNHTILELPLSETSPCIKPTFRSAFTFWLALIPF